MCSTKYGGALHQEQLMEVFLARTDGRDLPATPVSQALPPWAMQNLLAPYGIPTQDWAHRSTLQWQPEVGISKEGWFHGIGSIREQPIYSLQGIMPEHIEGVGLQMARRV
jgi:hypothetical protein